MSDMIHDPSADVASAEVAAVHLPIWEEAYRQAFPGFDCMEFNTDLESQRRGVDRIIHLKDGTCFSIDEKVRTDFYGDILIEHLSNNRNGAPGWIEKDQDCSYIAYAIPSAGLLYLLPFKDLQSAYRNLYSWSCDNKKSRNGTYDTEFVVVPIDELKQDLGKRIEYRTSRFRWWNFSYNDARWATIEEVEKDMEKRS